MISETIFKGISDTNMPLNIGLTNDLCYGSCQPYCYCPDCRCNGLKIGAMNTTEIEVS